MLGELSRQADQLVELVKSVNESTLDNSTDMERAFRLIDQLVEARALDLLRSALAELTEFVVESPAARELFLLRLPPVMLADLQRECMASEVKEALAKLLRLRLAIPAAPSMYSPEPFKNEYLDGSPVRGPTNYWGDPI